MIGGRFVRNTMLIVFGLGAAMKLSGPSGVQAPRTSSLDVVSVSSTDPAMATAYSRARATLPTFFDAMARPAASMSDFSVAVGLDTSRGRVFMWLLSPLKRGDQVSGTVGNTPSYTSLYKAGQAAQFPETAVVDWTYMDSGQMKGNFTACAVSNGLSGREKQNFERQYRINCLN